MTGRKTKRKVVRIEETEIPGSCHGKPPVPVWRAFLECGHYVDLSKKSNPYRPDTPRHCSICRHQGLPNVR